MILAILGAKPFVILGRRVHHGLAGMWIACAGLALLKPRLVILGALLMLDDIADVGFWHRDFRERKRGA